MVASKNEKSANIPNTNIAVIEKDRLHNSNEIMQSKKPIRAAKILGPALILLCSRGTIFRICHEKNARGLYFPLSIARMKKSPASNIKVTKELVKKKINKNIKVKEAVNLAEYSLIVLFDTGQMVFIMVFKLNI